MTTLLSTINNLVDLVESLAIANLQTVKVRAFEQYTAVTNEARAVCMIFEVAGLKNKVMVQICNVHLVWLFYRRDPSSLLPFNSWHYSTTTSCPHICLSTARSFFFYPSNRRLNGIPLASAVLTCCGRFRPMNH